MFKKILKGLWKSKTALGNVATGLVIIGFKAKGIELGPEEVAGFYTVLNIGLRTITKTPLWEKTKLLQ